mgnify:CR=1 FL=1
MKKSLLIMSSLLLFGSCSSARNSNNVIMYSVSTSADGVRTANVAVSSSFSMENLTIPTTISFEGNDYTVTGIRADAFKGNKYIKKVNFPDTITWVGWDAFKECKNLEYVNLGKGLASLGDHVFSYSNKLNVVEGGDNLKTLYKGVFEGTSIKSINFPSLEKMDIDCFWNNQSLKEVTFGDSLVSISGSAFEKCSSLERVNLSSNTTEIGNYAFKDCSKLKDIDFSHFDSIGIASFAYTGIEKVDIKKCRVYHSAFRNCKSLTAVNYESEEIPYKLFGNCDNITSVTLKGVKTIGSNAFVNDPLTSINIPSSVEYINSEAFSNCKLNTLTFENDSNLKSIHRKAFYNNPLSGEITLPQNIEKIYAYAFKKTKLNKINISSKTEYEKNIADEKCIIEAY